MLNRRRRFSGDGHSVKVLTPIARGVDIDLAKFPPHRFDAIAIYGSPSFVQFVAAGCRSSKSPTDMDIIWCSNICRQSLRMIATSKESFTECGMTRRRPKGHRRSRQNVTLHCSYERQSRSGSFRSYEIRKPHEHSLLF